MITTSTLRWMAARSGHRVRRREADHARPSQKIGDENPGPFTQSSASGTPPTRKIGIRLVETAGPDNHGIE
jgi:hypothetical protein